MPGNFRDIVLLYADLVESTRWQARYGLDAYQAMRRMVDTHMADTICAAGDGREMEKEREGDSHLIWFERADKAVAVALWWRRLLANDPAWPAEWERIDIRIGISQGSVDFSSAEADKAGLVLNKSARIDNVALAGQILLEESVYDSALELAGQSFREHLPGAGERFPAGTLRWERHGEYEFKGFGSAHVILYELYAPSWGEKSKGPPRDTEMGDLINRHWRPEAGKPILTREEFVLEKKLGEGGFGEAWVTGRMRWAGVAALWLLVIAAATGYGMWRAIQAERRMEAEKAAAEAAERKALRLADAGGKFVNRSLTELLDTLDNTPGSASSRQALFGAAQEYITNLLMESNDVSFTPLFSASDACRKMGNVYKAMGRSDDARASYLNARWIDSQAQGKALDFLNAHSESIGGGIEDLLSLSSGYYQLGKLTECGFPREEQLRIVEKCYANALKTNETLVGKIEERLHRSNGNAEANAFMQLEYLYSQLEYISEYSVSPSLVIIRESGSGATVTRKFASESRFLQEKVERVFRDAKERGRFEGLSGESGRYADIRNGNRDDIPVFGDVDRTIAQIIVNSAHNMLCMPPVDNMLSVARGKWFTATIDAFGEYIPEILSWAVAMRRADVRHPISRDLFSPVFFSDPVPALATALDEALFAVRKNSPEIPSDAESGLKDIGDAFSSVRGLSVKPGMTMEDMRAVLTGMCDNLADAAESEDARGNSSGCFDNFEIYDAVANFLSVLRKTSPMTADGAPDSLGGVEESLEHLARDILTAVKMNASEKDAPIPSHKLRKREIERNVNDTLADIGRFLDWRRANMTPDALPAFFASPDAEDWKRNMEKMLSDARVLWNWDRERPEHGLLYSNVLLLNALLRNMASEEDSGAKRNRLAECITELETLDREMDGTVERMKVLLAFAHGMLGKNFLESNLVDEAEVHFVKEAEYIDALYTDKLTGKDISFELWHYRIASLGNQVSLQVAKGRFEKIADIYSDLVYFMESPFLSERSIFLMREAEHISSGVFEFLKVMLDICSAYYHDDKGEAHYSEIIGLDAAEAKAGLSMILGYNSPGTKAMYWNKWKRSGRIDGDPRLYISRRKLAETGQEFTEKDMKDSPDMKVFLGIIYKTLVRGREYDRWCAFWY